MSARAGLEAWSSGGEKSLARHGGPALDCADLRLTRSRSLGPCQVAVRVGLWPIFLWTIAERNLGQLTEACEKLAPAFVKTSEGPAAEVERLIAPAVAAMGYDIVRVLLSGKQRPRLQIMAERQDGAGMLVEDCVALSRAIEAILDVEDPIAKAYELEVSSPGIDRPLTRSSDFERFAGFEVKLETSPPHEGRRRWIGRLLGLEG